MVYHFLARFYFSGPEWCIVLGAHLLTTSVNAEGVLLVGGPFSSTKPLLTGYFAPSRVVYVCRNSVSLETARELDNQNKFVSVL